jgi:hypothetical protein
VADQLEIRVDDVAAFFDVPFHIYPPTSPYTSPLRADIERALDVGQNPLFCGAGKGVRGVFTAHRGGAPLGRIVAHVHGASNALYHERRGNFGFFDCADDPEVATALLDAAEGFVASHGCDRLVGNFNLTAMQQIGVVTGGFEGIPYVDMQYNPPHIPRLLEERGFRRTFPMTTFEVTLDGFDDTPLRTPAAEERLRDPELRWEELRARDFDRILEDVRHVLNDGFATNPMFVPLTREEMRFQARDLSLIIDPRITALVHDAEGPAGALLCIPDLNPLLRNLRSRMGPLAPWYFLKHRLRRRRAVVIFCSIAQRHQARGLAPAMFVRLIAAMKRCGYRSFGVTWIWDQNRGSLRQMERLGARPLHRLDLFERAVGTVPAPSAPTGG